MNETQIGNKEIRKQRKTERKLAKWSSGEVFADVFDDCPTVFPSASYTSDLKMHVHHFH